jgi:polysaccharide biosynthesis/export protein
MDQRTIVTSWVAVLAVLACAGIGAAQTPSSAAGNPAAADVVLRPGDVLRITVWPNPEASGEFTIEDSGYVMLPLLEGVRAAGVPVGELRAELRRLYGQAMRNPVVTVMPMFRVTVTGEVMRPGIQVITPTYSLFEVIGQAGGFRPQADAEKVRIVRAGQVIHYDALRALETGEGMDAIQLRSGDHVVVPARRTSILSFGSIMSLLQTASLIALAYDRFTRATSR